MVVFFSFDPGTCTYVCGLTRVCRCGRCGGRGQGSDGREGREWEYHEAVGAGWENRRGGFEERGLGAVDV